jgi:hypothetical protein
MQGGGGASMLDARCSMLICVRGRGGNFSNCRCIGASFGAIMGLIRSLLRRCAAHYAVVAAQCLAAAQLRIDKTEFNRRYPHVTLSAMHSSWRFLFTHTSPLSCVSVRRARVVVAGHTERAN